MKKIHLALVLLALSEIRIIGLERVSRTKFVEKKGNGNQFNHV